MRIRLFFGLLVTIGKRSAFPETKNLIIVDYAQNAAASRSISSSVV
jgi:hypothetical protein